jgi:hypothetical protein
MKQIRKTTPLLLAILLSAIPIYAQNNPGAAESNPIPGCTNADDLVSQAKDVISKLEKITPADWSNNTQSLIVPLRDLKGRAELLNNQLGYCYTRMWNSGEETMRLGEDAPKIIKMSTVAMVQGYLNFVYKTRFTDGDKSYFAGMIPTDVSQIPQCKGVPEFLPKVDEFLSQYKTNEAQDRVTSRVVMPYMDRGAEILDCALALEKNGNSAAAGTLYAKIVGIDALVITADTHEETNLKRALAIPTVQAQPIIIRYGSKSCTGHMWGSESYRTINWDCN